MRPPRISFIPTVLASSGIRSMLPRDVVIELMRRVSRESRTTRVARSANSSMVTVSPGSGGSLNATWPVMPMPPKQASVPPNFSIAAGDGREVARIRKQPLVGEGGEVGRQLAEEMVAHVAMEAEGIVDRDKLFAVGGEILVHVDDDEIAQAYALVITALGDDIELPDRTDRKDEDHLLPARLLGRQVLFHEVVGEAPDDIGVVRQDLDGDAGPVCQFRLRNPQEIHGIRSGLSCLGSDHPFGFRVEQVHLGHVDGHRQRVTAAIPFQRRHAGDDFVSAELEEEQRVGAERLDDVDGRADLGLGRSVVLGQMEELGPDAEDQVPFPWSGRSAR